MTNFKRGDVIKSCLRYTDQSRPALVVSSSDLEDTHGLLWVLMITSAENRGWSSDVPINNLTDAGMPVASVIRTAKIATIEVGDATRLGKTSTAVLRQASKHLERELGV